VRLTLTPIRNLLRRKPAINRPARPRPEPTPPPKPVYTLPARPPEPITVKDAGEPATGPVADATKVVDKVTRNKYVALVLEVLDIAGKSGAGLFAAALAYGTMFALIPVVLLMAGVLAWFIDDPQQRQEVLNRLIGIFPPLADFFAASLNGLVDARGALSIIGLVGLVWGASAFYGSLDEVMRRIFIGGGVRGEIDRRLRGIITIVGVLVLLIGTVLLSGVWAFLNQLVGNLAVWAVLLPLIALAVFVVAVLLIYLLVPTAPPSVRAAFPPALGRRRHWSADQPLRRSCASARRRPDWPGRHRDRVCAVDLAELQLPDAALRRLVGATPTRPRARRRSVVEI